MVAARAAERVRRFSLYNFVAEGSRDALLALLEGQGYAVRRLDGTTIHSSARLWAESARQLGHAASTSWDAYADHVAGALMPDDDEPTQVALVWAHADELAHQDLHAFCSAFDTLTTIARTACAQGTTVLLFFLGADFPALET